MRTKTPLGLMLSVALVATAIPVAAADFYVDPDQSGAGSAADSAFGDIASAINAASAGDTIWLRGGKTISVSGPLEVPARLNGLKFRTYYPSADVTDQAKMYFSSISLPALTVSAANVSFIDLSLTSDGLITNVFVTADGALLEGCNFSRTRASGKMCPLFWSDATGGMTVNGCHFKNLTTDNDVPAIGVRYSATIMNCDYYGVQNPAGGGVYLPSLTFISNSFVNCSAAVSGMSEYRVVGGLFRAANGGIGQLTLANNVMTNGNGGAVVGCWGAGLGEGGLYMHHNTVVGYDQLIVKAFDHAYSQNSTKLLVIDNLMDLTGSSAAIHEYSKSLWGRKSSYEAGSLVRNNAVPKDTVWSHVEVDDLYKLDFEANVTIKENVEIETFPEYLNQSDPTSSSYFRFRYKQAPWAIDKAYVGEDPAAPEFEKYIGVKSPLMGGSFTIRIR